ncbi:MAG: pitrilysin family protein [bacterium]|jgi:zinc protease|nr:pitrilysin family protein [bacterium]
MVLTCLTGPAATAAPLKKRVLPGGVSLIVIEDHSAKLAAVHIWISTGSKDETDDVRGISHFIEHLVFKGTARRSLGQIDRELDSIGAENNAMTSYDFTAYTVVGPSAEFSTILDIQVDMIMNAAFDPVEVEKEREVVLEEIKMDNDIPESVLWNLMLEAAYPKHPYHYPVIGTVESIKGIARETIIEYHQKKYVPSNITVVVVGNVNQEKVAKQVEQAFDSHVELAPPARKFVLGMSEQSQDRKETSLEISRTYLAVSFHGVAASERDFPALEVASALLGQGPGSILVRKLKDELGLVDSIKSYIWSPRSAGLLVIEAVLPPQNLEAVEMALSRELEIIKNSTIKPHDLRRAISLALSSYLFQTETFDQRAEMIGWQNTVATIELHDVYTDRIKAITSSELERILRKYIDFNRNSGAVVKPFPETGGGGR